MIRGRPINLWLGVVTAGSGVAAILLITAGLDPVFVAQLLGSLTAFLGAIIALIAGQPPSVNPGGAVVVHTSNGQPDAHATLDVGATGRVVVQERRTPPDG